MTDKPKTEMIKLNGTLMKSDGTSYKSDFFKFLELHPDDYSDISYTPEEANKVRMHLMHLSTGSSAAVPMMCGGAARCPFASRCPFVAIDKERIAEEGPACKKATPVGRTCLVEVNLLNEWTRYYVNEYDIEDNSFTELTMVRELAEIELMLWRIKNNLAKPENAELVQDVIVGVDKQGEPLTRQESSAFFDMVERLNNRKAKLVKLMVGDRQEKYKKEAALKIRESVDPSTSAAQLRGKIQKLLEEADKGAKALAHKEAIDINPEGEDAGESTTLTPEDLIGHSDEE